MADPFSAFAAEDDPAQAILSAKVRGVPINPLPEKLVCANDTGHLPMLFVYCTDNPLGMFESSRARPIERPRTQVVDLDARHALMLTRTDEVARRCSGFPGRHPFRPLTSAPASHGRRRTSAVATSAIRPNAKKAI